jgi:BolA protein
MNSTKKLIISKLNERFKPIILEVIDESHLHKGHSGYREGGESHFRLKISSEVLKKESLLKAHRMINESLREELKEKIHALAIEIM